MRGGHHPFVTRDKKDGKRKGSDTLMGNLKNNVAFKKKEVAHLKSPIKLKKNVALVL